MNNLVRVRMADLKIAKHPKVLTTLGLGSCVGIALFDSSSRIGGLAHIMLPNSNQVKNNSNKAKFADTAIIQMVEMMMDMGAKKRYMVAKLAGGAHMFSFSQASDIVRVGQRNVIASKEILEGLSIPIVAEDTGGNYGRTIELRTEDGILVVKTIGHGVRYI